MKKWDVTGNTNNVQRIMREHFENLYSYKLENLEEMDKFLDTFDLPKLNQEDISHINRSTTRNEIEVLIVYKQRKVHWMDSLPNSTRPLRNN
jgi:hypothetical protein